MAERVVVSDLIAKLRAKHPAVGTLPLALGDCRITLESNSASLLALLRDYFRHVLGDGGPSQLRISLIEAPAPDFEVNLRYWPREPDKVGQKESFSDVDGGRIVRKVKTSMQFLLGEDQLAIGPCEANANQVINLVNTQYMGWLMRRGFVLCHAAGVATERGGLCIAGVAGAGKSTLALHLISGGMRFVSNDRLLVGDSGAHVQMAGVPKMPRINPGTILANRDLWPVLSEERREALAAMPRDELWTLEEKYDADVDQLFGPGRIQPIAPLRACMILTWSHRETKPTRVWQGTFRERPALLVPLMKHPGPFILDAKPADHALEHDPAEYLAHLADVRVVELSGSVDFERGMGEARRLLDES